MTAARVHAGLTGAVGGIADTFQPACFAGQQFQPDGLMAGLAASLGSGAPVNGPMTGHTRRYSAESGRAVTAGFTLRWSSATWKATSAASGARARFQLPLIHRADMVQMPSSARHGDPNTWRSGGRSERHSALIGQPNRANMSSIIGKLVHYMLREAEDDL